MSTIRRLLLFAVLGALALSTFAQPAPEAPLDFGKGPMQWLMTREEQRAWRDVKTPAQAEEFILLFWARRDPTPGTLANETRLEIEERVKQADARFQEGKKRGALTERGRVLIVLGYPRFFGAESEKRSGQFMASGSNVNSSSAEGADVRGFDPTGGRAQAGREVWEYEYAHAQKYKLPKIEVVFISNQTVDGSMRRDPQRPDFTMALPHAIDYYIKSPELTKVPDWSRPASFERQARAAAEKLVVVEVPVKAAGAGRLTLVEDAFLIDAQSGSDPFATLANRERFKRDGEMGWAAEYCTGTGDTTLEAVKVGMKISGLINGERINFNAPPDDLVPDSIKASPGCYLVRGGIPLSEMDPGTYTLTISVAKPGGEGSYNLTREFQVE